MRNTYCTILLISLGLAIPVNTAVASESGLIEGVLTLVDLGGPVVWVLLVMSVFGLALVLYKALEFRHFSGSSFNHIDRVLAQLETELTSVVIEKLKQQPNPTTDMLIKGIGWLEKEPADEERVREELLRMGNAVMTRVNSQLRMLEQIAYLAPLLGLLGTVLGIINVFQSLAEASNTANASVMAGGIWEALLTTALGLSIAIPFSLASSALESHAAFTQSRIQDQLSRLFTIKFRLDYPLEKR